MNNIQYNQERTARIAQPVSPATLQLINHHSQQAFQVANQALDTLHQNAQAVQTAKNQLPWFASTSTRAVLITLLVIGLILGGTLGARALFLNHKPIPGMIVAVGAGLSYWCISLSMLKPNVKPNGNYAVALGALFVGPFMPLGTLYGNRQARAQLPALEATAQAQVKTTAEALKAFFRDQGDTVVNALQREVGVQSAQLGNAGQFARIDLTVVNEVNQHHDSIAEVRAAIQYFQDLPG